MPRTINTEDFIKSAVEVHGDRYDYSNVEYVKARVPVIIICKEHGEFEQLAHNHLRTGGCPKCSYQNRRRRPLPSASSEGAIEHLDTQLFSNMTTLAIMDESVLENEGIESLTQDDYDYVTDCDVIDSHAMGRWKDKLNWDRVFSSQRIEWDFLKNNIDLVENKDRITYLLENRYSSLETIGNLEIELTPEISKFIFNKNIEFRHDELQRDELSDIAKEILNNISFEELDFANINVNKNILLNSDYEWEEYLKKILVPRKFGHTASKIDAEIFEKYYEKIMEIEEKIGKEAFHKVIIKSASEEWILKNRKDLLLEYARERTVSDETLEYIINFDSIILDSILDKQMPSVDFILRNSEKFDVERHAKFVIEHIVRHSDGDITYLLNANPEIIDYIYNEQHLSFLQSRCLHDNVLTYLIKNKIELNKLQNRIEWAKQEYQKNFRGIGNFENILNGND